MSIRLGVFFDVIRVNQPLFRARIHIRMNRYAPVRPRGKNTERPGAQQRPRAAPCVHVDYRCCGTGSHFDSQTAGRRTPSICKFWGLSSTHRTRLGCRKLSGFVVVRSQRSRSGRLKSSWSFNQRPWLRCCKFSWSFEYRNRPGHLTFSINHPSWDT